MVKTPFFILIKCNKYILKFVLILKIFQKMKKILLSVTTCLLLLTACKSKQVEQIEQNRNEQISLVKKDFKQLKADLDNAAKNLEQAKANHDREVEKTAQQAYDDALQAYKEGNNFRKKRNATLEKDWHQAVRKAKSDIRDATQKLETAKANHDKEAEKLATQAYEDAQKNFEEAITFRKRENVRLENDWHRGVRKAKIDLQNATQKLEAAKANHDKEAEKQAQLAYEEAQRVFDEAINLRKEHNKAVESDLNQAVKRAENRFYRVEKQLIEAKNSQNKEAEKIAQEAYDKAIKDLQQANSTTTKLINESDARIQNLTNKK